MRVWFFGWKLTKSIKCECAKWQLNFIDNDHTFRITILVGIMPLLFCMQADLAKVKVGWQWRINFIIVWSFGKEVGRGLWRPFGMFSSHEIWPVHFYCPFVCFAENMVATLWLIPLLTTTLITASECVCAIPRSKYQIVDASSSRIQVSELTKLKFMSHWMASHS